MAEDEPKRRTRATNKELTERRLITLRVFLSSSMNLTSIANAVGQVMTAEHTQSDKKIFRFDRHDIKRDLDYWREGNAAKYAPGKFLDAGQVIGEALDTAEFLQKETMQNYTNAAARTGRDREQIHKLDRLIRTAWLIQRDRLNLMFNLGLVNRETAGQAIDAKRFGNLVDYQRMLERVKMHHADPIEAPGTKKWLGTLPTDETTH